MLGFLKHYQEGNIWNGGVRGSKEPLLSKTIINGKNYLKYFNYLSIIPRIHQMKQCLFKKIY
jgi:hypothetical protein